MAITIRPTADIATALRIAENNPHFFNRSGLQAMAHDMANHTLIGAYDGDQMCGFIVFKELNAFVKILS